MTHFMLSRDCERARDHSSFNDNHPPSLSKYWVQQIFSFQLLKVLKYWNSPQKINQKLKAKI